MFSSFFLFSISGGRRWSRRQREHHCVQLLGDHQRHLGHHNHHSHLKGQISCSQYNAASVMFLTHWEQICKANNSLFFLNLVLRNKDLKDNNEAVECLLHLTISNRLHNISSSARLFVCLKRKKPFMCFLCRFTLSGGKKWIFGDPCGEKNRHNCRLGHGRGQGTNPNNSIYTKRRLSFCG